MTGLEIRQIRLALGMSQSELAQVLGVHGMTISKWERDIANPNQYQASLLRSFSRAIHRRPDIGDAIVKGAIGMGIAYVIFKLLESAFEE